MAEPRRRLMGGTQWLTRRRLLNLGILAICALHVLLWLSVLGSLSGVLPMPSDYPKIDFSAFWAASSLALKGAAASAYDTHALVQEQIGLPGDDSVYQPWRNPPIYFFFVLPLAALPFVASLVGWVAATGALLLGALRRMTADRTVLLLALAFPATFNNVVAGQNGFLTAGLLAWGMVLLRDRPIAAGVVLGFMAFKPQFFPLVMLALLAGGHWRAFAGAAACVGVASVASLVVFGFASWEGFFRMAGASSDQLYGGQLTLGKIQSVSALALRAGVSVPLAQAAQAVATLAAAGFVVWLWRRDVGFEYKAAGLAAAILLATPYSYLYDLTLLGLAGLWVWLGAQQYGWQRGEAKVVALAWLAPLSFRLAGFSVTPLVVLALLFLVLQRARDRRGSEGALDKRPATLVVAD